MTRPVYGRDTQVRLNEIDLTPYVSNLEVRQSISPIDFGWGRGWGRENEIITYGRPETTITIEGVWTEETDRLYSIAPTYEIQGGGDGPVMFRVEWAIADTDITWSTTDLGQTVYTASLPVPNAPRPARLTFSFDNRPAPVLPNFTVTPWGVRSLTPEERQAREEEQARQRQAKEDAYARARRLLLRHLSEAQRAEFEAHGRITEALPPPYGTAQISRSTVRLLDDQYPDTTRARYCLIPSTGADEPPWDDVVLARLLLLRHDPVKFFSLANQIG